MSSESSPKKSTPPIVIAGAGLTGLSAALHLSSISPNTDWMIFEKDRRIGGLATSETVEGYTFDKTGHWLHLRDPELKKEVLQWMEDDLLEVERESRSFSRGVLTGYPFQVFLHGHQPNLILDCLKGLWESREKKTPQTKPKTFEDFILRHFGKGIARHFLVPYNEKLWGVPPREITADWCQRFVPVPPVEQILAGAVGAKLPNLGYNAQFLYPKKGGIGELSKALYDQLEPSRVHTSSPLEKIDFSERRVFVGGQWVSYSQLITTLPLPLLVKKLVSAPKNLSRAGEKLRATPVVYLDVATRPAVRQSYHWVYLPDEGHPFYRVGVYSNAAPHMAPPNGSSLYVELADRDTSKSLDATMQEAVPALQGMGLIDSKEDILFARRHTIPHAYVIYDHNYTDSRTALLSFLQRHGIYSVGRYGSWVYHSMEDSMLEGRQAAQRALDREIDAK